jgi:hypothetical protein
MNKLYLLLVGLLSWSALAATGGWGLEYVDDDPVLNAQFAKGEIIIAPGVDLSDEDNLVLYYDASAPEAWPEIQLARGGKQFWSGPDTPVRYRGGGGMGQGGGGGRGGMGGPDAAMRRFCVSMSPQASYRQLETRKGARWIRPGCNCFPNPAIHMLECRKG